MCDPQIEPICVYSNHHRLRERPQLEVRLPFSLLLEVFENRCVLEVSLLQFQLLDVRQQKLHLEVEPV